MNVLNKEETTTWCPPSDAIQRLFRFDSEPAVYAASEIAPKPAVLTASNTHSFTEEDFAKMPSTLMKAVRRTDLLLAQNELIRKAAIDTHNELKGIHTLICLLYTSPSPRDRQKSRMPSSA